MSSRCATGIERQTALWILRTLARSASGGGAGVRAPYDLELLASVGVPTPPAGATQDRAKLRRAIVARARELEAASAQPSLASGNAALLGAIVGLSAVEVDVLAFTIACDAEEALGSSFGALRARNFAHIVKHVAAVLGRRPAQVERALRRDARLRELTLVRLARADSADSGPLTLGASIWSAMLRPLQNEQDLVRHFLDPMAPSTLSLGDYPHLAGEVDLLQRLLRAALDRREPGLNVLLYGAPGTGKSELARALAESIGARLEAVKLVDGDDDVRDGSERLESYSICQRILSGRRGSVLLFDEAEDAFPCGSWLTQARSGRNKAWTNRLLEENAVPTIWISNAIDQIDRAFVRRFDLLLEVGEPPRTVRRGVLEKHLRALDVRPTTLERMAEREELSPGHAQRAGRVLRLLRASGRSDADADLTRVVEANLRAYAGPAKRRRRQPELGYDLSLLRTDTDPLELVRGLSRTRAGTVCLYGPAGSGKTALAHHLARELDLPLLDYRASDLMSKWVGDTERGIARMFERAVEERAVLLLDEADGVLAERSRARNSWEITQVNEMLSQMEQFTGVFVCSTNLVEHLDRAALRRFALKVRFDYLNADQVERLFRELLRKTGDRPSDAECARAVYEARRLANLTPGDFAAVARRLEVLGAQSHPGELVKTLVEEAKLKRDRGGRLVGFTP